MPSEPLADYRNQAENCLSRAQTTSDTQARLHWLTIAEDWLLMASRVEMKEARIADRANDY